MHNLNKELADLNPQDSTYNIKVIRRAALRNLGSENVSEYLWLMTYMYVLDFMRELKEMNDA